MSFRFFLPASLRRALIPVLLGPMLLGAAGGVAQARPATTALALGVPGDATARRFAGVIDAASRRHGVDGALIHAIILAESSWDPEAVSPQGALGLMQLMPETAQRYGVSDPFDPAQNIEGGARMLKDLLELFERDIELSIAAYNSGANAVIRAGHRIPANAETLAFVPRVIGYYQSYRVAAEAAERQLSPDAPVFIVARGDAIRLPVIDLGSTSDFLDRGLPSPEHKMRLVGIVSNRRARPWHLSRIRGSGAASSLIASDPAMRDRRSEAGANKPRRTPKIQHPGPAVPRATALKGRRRNSI